MSAFLSLLVILTKRQIPDATRQAAEEGIKRSCRNVFCISIQIMQMESAHFPATPIALKMAVAIGIGMLAEMEREWSNKDVGIRTFAIVSLLGMLASVVGQIV